VTLLNSGKSIRATAAIMGAALLISLFGPSKPASAQNFLEELFGGIERRIEQRRAATLPPRAHSYADPFHGPRPMHRPGYIAPRDRDFGIPQQQPTRRPTGDNAASYGGGTVFCVRTCDGRFFPMQRRASASPAQLCQAFCPASRTMVFSGSRIDHAVAPNGQRYAGLNTAFLYREKTVENCTCNGKDPFGLARVELSDDPTLRTGDIVATNDGLATFQGRSARAGEFTPIDSSRGEWARRLAEVKVRPAPPPAPTTETPAAEPEMPARSNRRVQASR
jgi:hypothetical protein